MTPAEKLNRLIDLLEGGQAVRLARRAGIDTASLSRARNGKADASFYFPRILTAYPEIRPQWLLDDEGEPTFTLEEKGRLEAKIDGLTKEVRDLRGIILELAKSFSKVTQTKKP